jgi:hypothetical protein
MRRARAIARRLMAPLDDLASRSIFPSGARLMASKVVRRFLRGSCRLRASRRCRRFIGAGISKRYEIDQIAMELIEDPADTPEEAVLNRDRSAQLRICLAQMSRDHLRQDRDTNQGTPP